MHNPTYELLSNFFRKQYFLKCYLFYGFNLLEDICPLWDDVMYICASMVSHWRISGDFNSIVGGRGNWNPEMTDFRDFTLEAAVLDLRKTGEFFTWLNKRHIDPLYRNIDRVLINKHWLEAFPEASYIFIPRGLSDHSLVIVNGGIRTQQQRKRF